MEFLIHLIKRRFGQMVFEHKREFLSKELDKKQTSLGQSAHITMRLLGKLNAGEYGVEDVKMHHIQNYIDTIQQSRACIGLSLRLCKHIQAETLWVHSLEFKHKEKLGEDFFAWQESIRTYISTTLTFTAQMLNTASLYYEALNSDEEQQNQLANLIEETANEMQQVQEILEQI